MKRNSTLADELLQAWVETYKKGQLTLWIFLALRENAKYVGEIKEFIEQATENSIVCEEQSLYRALRKFQLVDMVGFSPGKGNSGPDRKYYHLTPMGAEILDQFIESNIKIFFRPEIKSLLDGGRKPGVSRYLSNSPTKKQENENIH